MSAILPILLNINDLRMEISPEKNVQQNQQENPKKERKTVGYFMQGIINLERER